MSAKTVGPAFHSTVLFILAICLTADIYAATYTWSAISAGAASQSANWTPAGVPAAGDTVVFNGTSNQTCQWNIAVTLGHMHLASTFSGVFDADTTVDISADLLIEAGEFNINGYRLEVGGDLTRATGATYNRSSGHELILDGSTAQVLDLNDADMHQITHSGTGSLSAISDVRTTISGFTNLAGAGDVDFSGVYVTVKYLVINDGTFSAPGVTKAMHILHSYDVSPGAVFVHNNGTVHFSYAPNSKRKLHTGGSDPNHDFYNLIIDQPQDLIIESEGLLVENRFRINGTVFIDAPVNVTGTLNLGEQADVHLDGDEVITYGTMNLEQKSEVYYEGSGSYATLPLGNHYWDLTFNDSSGTWAHGTTTLDVDDDLVVQAGTLNSNGYDITLGGDWKTTGSYLSGSNTVTFDGTGKQLVSTHGSGESRNFNSLILASADTVEITGWSLDAGGNLTVSSGVLSAQGFGINVGGSFTVSDGATVLAQGNETVNITGAVNFQAGSKMEYSGTGAYSELPFGTIYDNLVFGSTGSWGFTNASLVCDTLSIQNGTLSQTTQNIQCSRLVVGSGATLSNQSTGDLILGAGGLSSNGTVILDGNGAGCDANANSIGISSSIPGTQRPWSGTGTFTISDVTLTDQGGTASITASGSTDGGGNGSNWTINSSCSGGENYEQDWMSSQQITINTSSTGANLSTSVFHFPLLVRLDEGNFPFSQADTDGADIRFASSSGKPLDYHIDEWSSSSKAALVWVDVDTINANDATQYITMYWNNSSAPSRSNPQAVFGSGENFQAAWHLNDLTDASDSEYDLVNNGTVASDGIVGKTRYFDGQSSAQTDTLLDPANQGAVAFWTRVENLSARPRFLGSCDSFEIRIGADKIHSELFSTGLQNLVSSSKVTGNTWFHVLSTWDHTTGAQRLYINGELDAEAFNADDNPDPAIFSLGTRTGETKKYLQGHLDEVRISTKVRSADWAKLTYLVQGSKHTSVVAYSEGSLLPSGSVSLTEDIDSTSNPSPPLAISYFSATQMRLGLTTHAGTVDTADASWKDTADIDSIDISADGPGMKRIWIQFKNSDNAVSSWTYDSVAYYTLTPPRAVISPSDTTIAVGTSLTLSATLTQGDLPVTYAWLYDGAPISGASGPYLTLSNVQRSDAGIYRVVVQNSAGTDTSAAASVSVPAPVEARFTVLPPLQGTNSLSAAFVDQSTGDIASWHWYFGDGDSLVYTSARDTVRHTYTEIGEFAAKLKVKGVPAAGQDSTTSSELLRVVSRGSNPVTVTATYLSPTRMEIVLDGYDTLPTTPVLATYAEHIGLWFGKNNTIDTSRSQTYREYSVDSLRAVDRFIDTLTVPAPSTPADTTYLFWVHPLWSAKLDSFNHYNASSVRMHPRNPFTISADYLGNRAELPSVDPDASALDSMLITATITEGTFDTAALSEMEISWRIGSSRTTELISPSEILQGLNSTTYLKGLQSPLFFGDTQTVFLSLSLTGDNGLRSSTAYDTVVVGWPKADNPFTLSKVDSTTSRITVSWNKANGIDSVRVLVSRDTIPLGTIHPNNEISVVSPGPSADLIQWTVVGLNPNVRYFFAVQARVNFRWTDVSSSSRLSVATANFTSGGVIDNIARVDSVVFDSTTNRILVHWHLDSLPTTLDLGVTWGTDSALAVSVNPSIDTGLVITDTEINGTTELKLESELVFDTTYHVALWLRSSSGKWASPVPASIGSVRIPLYTWQVVSLFTQDTVVAFNENIMLWRDETHTITAADTIRYVTPPAGLDRFIPVGGGISFSEDSPLPFYVGLRYDSIPAGLTTGDIGLYRDSSGALLAIHGVNVDSSSRYVFVKSKDFADEAGNPYSFYILADPAAPSLDFATAIDSPISGTGNLRDTVTITDNVANVLWRVYYAKNDEAFIDQKSFTGFACGSCTSGEMVSWEIPSGSISEKGGVRIRFVVSDGVHIDTLDLSRSIRRLNSDKVTVPSMRWTPLWSTAELDSNGAAQVLDELSQEEPWIYDNTAFRLFRFVDHDDNIDHPSGKDWLEYSPDNDDYFRFVPGRVFWLKARSVSSTLIGLGAGKSFSYRKSAEFRLPSYEWAHIALPWSNYSVCIGDILDATPNHDLLEFYVWRPVQSGDEEYYLTELIYSSTVEDPGVQNKAYALTSKVRTAYSVFNNNDQKDLTISIPPTPSTMSHHATGLARKSSRAADGWSYKVVAETEDYRLSPIYCGYRKGDKDATMLPSSPSFAPVTAGIYDRKRGNVFGHIVTHSMENGGFSFKLSFANSSQSKQRLRFSLKDNAEIPEGIQAQVLQPGSHKWEVPDEGWISVDLDPGSLQQRTVAIGNESYLSLLQDELLSARVALLGCYPNPSHRIVNLRFRIPLNAQVGTVRFFLYNMQGQVLWQKALSSGLAHGVNNIAWDGRSSSGKVISPGAYILRMNVYGINGDHLGEFKRSIVRVR